MIFFLIYRGLFADQLSQLTQAALDQTLQTRPAADNQYSRYEIHKLTCRVCQHSADYLIWNVANAKSRPVIKSYAKAGVIHQVYCHYCGSAVDRPIPLLYCSPDEDKYFLWAPPDLSTPSGELTNFVFAYFSSLPIELRAGRPQVMVVDKYIDGWQHAEEYVIVSKVCHGDEFFSLVSGSTQSLRAQEDARIANLPKHSGVPSGGLASTPHPAADPDRAARLNLEHIQAMAEWKALPAWKRILRKKPVRPTGI